MYKLIKFGNNKIVTFISCLVIWKTCQKYNIYGNDCYPSCNSTSIPGKLSTDFAVKFFIHELLFDDTFSLHFFRLQIMLNIFLGEEMKNHCNTIHQIWHIKVNYYLTQKVNYWVPEEKEVQMLHKQEPLVNPVLQNKA